MFAKIVAMGGVLAWVEESVVCSALPAFGNGVCFSLGGVGWLDVVSDFGLGS